MRFNDSENIPPLLPEGDYVFCCTGFECKLSTGGRTSGSDAFELELRIEPSGKLVREQLIDHPSCTWKIDTFIKSVGVKLAKGESFEFRKDRAEANGVKWVNPLGLRGYCRLYVDEYKKKDGTQGKSNKVATFYTDKPKLAAVVIEAEEEEDKPF